jgi:hypothetical protein
MNIARPDEAPVHSHECPHVTCKHTYSPHPLSPNLALSLPLSLSLGLRPASSFFFFCTFSPSLYARLGVRVRLGALPRKSKGRRLHFTLRFIGTAPKQIVPRPAKVPERRASHLQIALNKGF